MAGPEGGEKGVVDPYDATSMRYQQVYDASFFTGGPPSLMLITEIRFRCDAGAGAISGPFSAVISDIQISMSTTVRPSESLLSTFSDNIGADVRVVVPRGPLALSSSYTNDGTGARTFDIRIPLTTPFSYNPALGNLLLDVTNYSGTHLTTSNWIAFDAANSPTDGISRLYGSSSFSTIGTSQNMGLVTQFVVVPEPSIALFLGLTPLAVMLRRRR